MRFTLRVKLITLTAFVVTLLMTAVTAFVTVQQNRERLAAARSQTRRLARSTATLKSVDDQDWGAYQQFITNLGRDNDDVVYIAVYDGRRALRAHVINFTLLDLQSHAPLSPREEVEIVRKLDRGAVAEQSRTDLHSERVEIKSGDRVLGFVHVGLSLIKLREQLWSDLRRNAQLALGGLVLSSLIAVVLSRRLTGPIERLSTAMTAIAAGDLEQRVRPETHDEIGALASTFNDMADGLREGRIVERLGLELAATFQIDRLGERVRERMVGAIGAESARLFLGDHGEGGRFRELAEGDPRPRAGRAPATIELDAHCQNLLATSPDGSWAERCPSGAREALGAAGISGGDLLVPMLVQGRLLGFLAVRVTGGAAGLDARRRHFAVVLARQAALALDNAMLYQELSEQARLRGELEAAREVQRRLLPGAMPVLPGWQFDAVCRPALEVGGDYFDFLRLPDGRLGMVVADVSGKGSSASMYMAQLKGMMLVLVARESSPARVLSELNHRLYPSLDRRIFASVLYGVLEPASGELTLARAGHCPLVVVRHEGRVEVATPGGIAVGLDPGPRFDKTLEEVSLRIRPDDLIAIYTDGITDAMNPGREAWGGERLLVSLQRGSALAPAELRDTLLAEIDAFTGGGAPFDDLTLLLARRGPAPRAGTGTSPVAVRIPERG